MMPTILVIDDDGLVRSYLRDVLDAGGYTVSEASDGEEGLRQFQDAVPDLVLCDLYMPGREGMETIRELKRLRPDVPVVAMSGGSAAMGDYLPLAKALGAADALRKPVSPEHLLQTVARLLAGRSG
jgi:CheY-like chemotaxis protein